jgi:hypothetical protein
VSGGLSFTNKLMNMCATVHLLTSNPSLLHFSLPLQMVRSVSATPRRASMPCSRVDSHTAGAQVQRQQELALQRILEEEILKEMDREAALREVRQLGECIGCDLAQY